MATAAMKLNARGAAKRHIRSPLASKEYGVVCLHNHPDRLHAKWQTTAEEITLLEGASERE